MKTYQEYIDSLKDDREVYYRGERVTDVTTHPILKYTPMFLGSYEYHHASDEKLREELNELYFIHPELGVKATKFYRIPRSSADLLEHFELVNKFTMRYRFNVSPVGSDMVKALILTSSYLGGEYAKRMSDYAEHLLRETPVLAAAQMDVKGDRSARPAEQADLDLHVHVVDEKPDGIIVRGAKANISWVYAANEIVVIPCRTMRKGEEEFAIAFATPVNAKGIRLLCRPCLELEPCRNEMENPRLKAGGHFGENTIIFDNVFIPWERVFVYKNSAEATRVALTFALIHRFTSVSYHSGLAEFLIGAGKLMADYNGIENAAHIKRDIVDLIDYCEIMKLCVKLAAYECTIDPKTGMAIPNPIYTNLGKLYSNTRYFAAKQALIDIAGGIAITAPSSEDYMMNETLRKDIDKYLAGKGVSGTDRFKLILLIRELVALWGGLEDVTFIQAEGSIWASVMELHRTYNYDKVVKAVKENIGIA